MKTKALLTIIFAIILVSCSPAITPASIQASTPIATITAISTLPPTLTPAPTSTQSQVTPTALYTPVELSSEDNEAFQKALSDIPLYRQGDIQINVQDESGNPLSSYQVKYRQTSHDFIFGSVIFPAQTGQIQEAGINYWDFEMQWQWIQPQEKKFTFDFVNYWEGVDEMKSARFGTMASAMFLLLQENGRDIPPYWREISFDEFLKKEYEYVSATVKRFGPSIDVWEAISEPNFDFRNPLNLTKEQYYQAIAVSSKAIRDNDPTAVIEINLGVPCGQIAWKSDFEIVQGLLDRNIDFDQIGLQFYNNSYAYNGFYFGKDSLTEMSECWNSYEKILAPNGKKLKMTEMAVSSDRQGSQLGYWNVPWTEDTQAQYLEKFYTIFFAKPTNTGLSWYHTLDTQDDQNSFVIYKGGLIREDGTPKKSYFALQNLIKEWTTTGDGETDQDGLLTFRGFGGDYEVQITDPKTGGRMYAQVHVTEQKFSGETITFIPNKQLNEQKEKLEKLVAYWESDSNAILASKGHDYLALVNHHLQNAEWQLAEQTISAALDELAITIELDIPVEKFKIASPGVDQPIIDNHRVVIWGADTLYYPYDFPSGTVSVEVVAHSQSEKGEFPSMVLGVGASYSEMWKVENPQPQTYSFTMSMTGTEKVFTIRNPYIEQVNQSIITQNGNVGELKLFIDEVKLIIKTTEAP